jgi:hypothetical protein
VEGEIKYKPHALQVLTDDDEIELAYYFFDDHFLKQNPGKADYLLHEDWRLPTTSDEGSYAPSARTKKLGLSRSGPGKTYIAFLAFYDSSNLSDLDVDGPPRRIEGVRVPQLAAYLAESLPDKDWPFELKLLRSQLSAPNSIADRLKESLERVARLPVLEISNSGSSSRLGMGTVEQARDEIDDVLKAVSQKAVDHDPSQALTSVAEHSAQLCLPVGWESAIYHQWIIFDDLWAGEHRELAEGILRFATRWDVLTVK